MRGIRVWARLLGLKAVVVEGVYCGNEGDVIVAVRPRWRERDPRSHGLRRHDEACVGTARVSQGALLSARTGAPGRTRDARANTRAGLQPVLTAVASAPARRSRTVPRLGVAAAGPAGCEIVGPVSVTVSIPRRFNGPLESGNGGYCAGVVAGFVEGAAEVSLRRPVPLDTPLDVVREEGGSVRLLDGEVLVAEARSAPELQVEVPSPVSPREARVAAAGYRGLPDGLFSRCFVCGRAREDALGVFAGTVDGRQLVASPWTPPAWTADATGRVLPEFVWAVLDCPTYFALYVSGELPMSVLARLTARLDAPIVAGEEYIVIAWPLTSDGRKRHAGSAVLSPDGHSLAVAQALLIEPRPA